MENIFVIAGSLGVGGFLGALIFVMYRTDKKATENHLVLMAKSYEQVCQQNFRVMTDLTIAINLLRERIK